jgi:predicted molibdopterin-dependent oxidoreductase YjgC
MAALQADLAQLDFVLTLDVRGPTLKADVVLPLATVPEKGGTLTSGDRLVQAAEVVLQPPGAARGLIDVLKDLAARLGADGFAYENSEAVLDEIRREVPAYAGAGSAAKPVQWPCPQETHPGTPVLFADELPPWRPPVFDPPPSAGETPDEAFPFALVAKERLEPFFSGPLLAGEALAAARHDGMFEMNPADGFGMGLRPGDAVRVSTRSAQWEGTLAMNALLPAGMVAIPGVVMGQESPAEAPPTGEVCAAAVEKVEQKVA